jgi:hypothetical protein
MALGLVGSVNRWKPLKMGVTRKARFSNSGLEKVMDDFFNRLLECARYGYGLGCSCDFQNLG